MIKFWIVLGVVFAAITNDPNAILAGLGLAALTFGLQVLGEILALFGVKL